MSKPYTKPDRPKRNHKCPCGSNKKYKNCCIDDQNKIESKELRKTIDWMGAL